jgi:hypothetical protein
VRAHRYTCIHVHTRRSHTLNFVQLYAHTHTVAPPAPKDYSIQLDRYQPFPPTTSESATVAFNFTSSPMFNIIYAITAYKIRPLYSHSNREIARFNLSRSLNGIECPSICSSNEPCQCTGLELGGHVTVAIAAINCGNREGPAIEVSVTTCKPS